MSLAISAIALTLDGCATTPHAAPQSPGADLLVEAISILSTQPLGAGQVDWESVKCEHISLLPPDASHTDAYPAIRAAVDQLHDPHASFRSADEVSGWRGEPAEAAPAADATAGDSTADANASTSGTPPVPMWPSVRVLDDGVALVTVTLCGTGDVETLRRYASELSTAIREASARGVTSWVVDLRFNGGGNVWPMLLGLRPLLGDGATTTSIDAHGVVRTYGLGAEGAWLADRAGLRSEQLRLDPMDVTGPVRADRIAVLIGAWTMSSGEFVAGAFRGDARARLFGEPTAGLTTEVTFFPLGDGSELALPVAVLGDREGRPLAGPIAPDEAIEAGDWPKVDDAQAKRARAWATGTR